MESPLLCLPNELRNTIFKDVLKPIKESTPDFGVDVYETDPSKLFTVLAHKKCFNSEDLDGICMICMDKRPNANAVNATHLSLTESQPQKLPSLFTVCKQLYRETVPIFYGEREFFVAGMNFGEPRFPMLLAEPASILNSFYANTSDLALKNLRCLTVGFDPGDRQLHKSMHEICKGVIDNLLNIKTLTVLVDTASLEDDQTQIRCSLLADIAKKGHLTIEIVNFDAADVYYNQQEVGYGAYLESVQREVHEALDPIFE